MQSDPDSPEVGPPVDPLDQLLRSAQWPDDASDPLDGLLRMAQWPGPAAVRREGRRRAWAGFAFSAVAVLLVALALWSVRVSGDRSPPDVATTVARDATPQPPASPKPAIPQGAVARINSPDLRQAMVPGELRLRMLLARSKARAWREGDELIDRFLAQRIAEPGGDLQELIQPLLARRAEFEQRVLERFHALAGEQESAAIELLGYVGSRRSVTLLSQLRLRSSIHAPAVRALLKIADPGTLARLARTEEDPALREEITAALRARGDKQKLFFVLGTEGEPSCLESGSDVWRPSESL